MHPVLQVLFIISLIFVMQYFRMDVFKCCLFVILLNLSKPLNFASYSILQEPNNQLWFVTWQRVEQFLPNFLVELFPQSRPPPPLSTSPSPPSPPSSPPSSSPVSSPLAVPVVDQPRYQSSPGTADSSPLSQSPGTFHCVLPLYCVITV